MPNPRRYRAYGLVIESELSLPDLPGAAGEPVDCRVLRASKSEGRRFSGAERVRWVQRLRDREGKVWLAVGRAGSTAVIRAPGRARFEIDASGAEIVVRRNLSAPLSAVRHLLLDHVLPRVLDLRGDLVLHAGAVVTERGAILFLGRSGRGKSTLTASLARAGHAVIGDDVVVLRQIAGRWHALPSYPGLRLWEDSARRLLGAPQGPRHLNGKSRGDVRRLGGRFPTEPAPLARAYVLEPCVPTAVPDIAPLSTRSAFGEIAAHTFRFDPADPSALRDELPALVRLVSAPNVFHRLLVPRRYEALPEVHAALARDLASSSARTVND